ncbi:MAG: hypothetical protein JWP52_3055, partial [Rhizobacter sp.]|nr:hypothetical protein [Rhizobacter sp.]
ITLILKLGGRGERRAAKKALNAPRPQLPAGMGAAT